MLSDFERNGRTGNVEVILGEQLVKVPFAEARPGRVTHEPNPLVGQVGEAGPEVCRGRSASRRMGLRLMVRREPGEFVWVPEHTEQMPERRDLDLGAQAETDSPPPAVPAEVLEDLAGVDRRLRRIEDRLDAIEGRPGPIT